MRRMRKNEKNREDKKHQKNSAYESGLNNWFLLDSLEWLTSEIIEFDKETSLKTYQEFEVLFRFLVETKPKTYRRKMA